MAEIVRGPRTAVVDSLKAVLDEYERQHPGAVATLYEQNSASVRVRVVDPKFAALSKSQRHDQVWDFLAARLSDDLLQQISVLLLLTPAEQPSSIMNIEFDHPVPSGF